MKDRRGGGHRMSPKGRTHTQAKATCMMQQERRSKGVDTRKAGPLVFFVYTLCTRVFQNEGDAGGGNLSVGSVRVSPHRKGVRNEGREGSTKRRAAKEFERADCCLLPAACRLLLLERAEIGAGGGRGRAAFGSGMDGQEGAPGRREPVWSPWGRMGDDAGRDRVGTGPLAARQPTLLLLHEPYMMQQLSKTLLRDAIRCMMQQLFLAP
jgi:hypothetical protein